MNTDDSYSLSISFFSLPVVTVVCYQIIYTLFSIGQSQQSEGMRSDTVGNHVHDRVVVIPLHSMIEADGSIPDYVCVESAPDISYDGVQVLPVGIMCLRGRKRPVVRIFY